MMHAALDVVETRDATSRLSESRRKTLSLNSENRASVCGLILT